jgi:hypothetical protein
MHVRVFVNVNDGPNRRACGNRSLIKMETVVPATGEWNLCLDNPEDFSKFFKIPVLAWAINPLNCLPTPITPFGRADTAAEYMLWRINDIEATFIILPNGPVLPGNNFSGAKAWLRRKGQAA